MMLAPRPMLITVAQRFHRHGYFVHGQGVSTHPFKNESGKLTSSFFNGGLIFSTVVMLGIAAISLYCFLLLTKTYLVIPGSFGGEPKSRCDRWKLTPDIGGALYGKYMRLTILTSITVSQIGFVAGELSLSGIVALAHMQPTPSSSRRTCRRSSSP